MSRPIANYDKYSGMTAAADNYREPGVPPFSGTDHDETADVELDPRQLDAIEMSDTEVELDDVEVEDDGADFADLESYFDEYDRRQAGDDYESLRHVHEQRSAAFGVQFENQVARDPVDPEVVERREQLG